ncbi:peptide/nickel transport system ATP-binding protein [Tamaricihabitans halophyticus]|uniref:Peptide/nickel transport system ATP-binding protein n=1 Tax=Tamaricihabitans halophyticus TaxID=1262583 RepID=A0A4R2QMF9_9PSEU|nr:ABC transporter ATP-binding protein [Tamaricihabitans halophyticus]TCP50069.1 peptide/nickel transport system ATP-binding protein [Tamaricihabitans halophyticus]
MTAMSVAPGTEAPVLEVTDLRVQFATDRGWATVVDGVSFSVGRAETVGVVGESGSGKTVTSLAVLGLLPSPPARVVGGSIRLGDTELLGLRRRELEEIRGDEVAMIFQEPMTSLNPAFPVGDQIAEVFRRHRRCSRSRARARAVEMLGKVGIPDAARRARAYPHEFSGGMRQRAMIALAMCCDPRVLLADEPTTALDGTIQAQILDLMRSMRDEFDTAIVFVTHDLGVVADICDRAVVMYAGQVVEKAPIDDLYYHPRHPYTEALLGALPQLDGGTEVLATIPGTAPTPGALPAGCRFHPRCAHARPECAHPTESAADGVALRWLSDSVASRCVRVDELRLRGAR